MGRDGTGRTLMPNGRTDVKVEIVMYIEGGGYSK